MGLNASSVRDSAIGPCGNRFLQIEADLSARFAGRKGLKGKCFA